ncbi:MAG: hypothetical protein PHQ72_01595 [Hespellia sp.]|nr:hypothetical protein [Hespellia sp.]
MAICIVKNSIELGVPFVLTPERYNPKRRMNIENDTGILLSEIIDMVNDTLTMKKNVDSECFQVNTRDAMGGYLKVSQVKEKINSNKKIIKKGDVIISRLRPYLKQVAYVDVDKQEEIIGASTEFYVLRARNEGESIAFLVPFLLSDVAQNVFANSVEGSQHPRFKEEDILNLVVPKKMFNNRVAISNRVIKSIKNYRTYEKTILKEISNTNALMKM